MDIENSLWDSIELGDGQVHFRQIDELNLWFKYHNEEIWMAYCYVNETEAEPDRQLPPESVKWSHWARKNAHPAIRLKPIHANLPLIVHSEYTLRISPHTEIKVYSRVPVWVAILMKDDDYQLIELPVTKLPKTWFGTPLEGELCYHITTKARRNLSRVHPEPHLITCPITISNRSAGTLDFEYFCFRVERLGIYLHKNTLWSDETEITYRGEEQNSDVVMTGKLPKGVTKQMQLSTPRRKIHSSLATRTFKHLLEDTLSLG